MKKQFWARVLGILLVVGVIFFGNLGISGQDKNVSPEDEAKIKAEEEARAKQIVFLKELRGNAAGAVQKWAKETDFDKIAKEIMEYAKGRDLTVTCTNMENICVDLRLNGIGDESGETFLFPISRILQIEITTPLLERLEIFEAKDLPLRDCITQLLKNVNYVIPEDKSMQEKRVTCRLQNMMRINALNLILDTHNYVLCVNGYEYRLNQQVSNYLLRRSLFDINMYTDNRMGVDWYQLIADKTRDDIWYKDYAKTKASLSSKISDDNLMSDAFWCLWLANNSSELTKLYTESIKHQINSLTGYAIISLKPQDVKK